VTLLLNYYNTKYDKMLCTTTTTTTATRTRTTRNLSHRMIVAAKTKTFIRRTRLRTMGTRQCQQQPQQQPPQQQQQPQHPEKSTLMIDAIPKLVEIFHHKATKMGVTNNSNTIPTKTTTTHSNTNHHRPLTVMNDIPVFPLFSPRVHDNIWKTVEQQPAATVTAAILVPIVDCQDHQPGLLFTQRSSTMPTHPSEVAFPGGHFDATAGDGSLEDTALREAQEELSFRGEHDDDNIVVDHHHHHSFDWQSNVRVIGRASALPSMNGTSVTPVIAVLTQPVTDTTFPGHPEEVERVFTVPLTTLLQVERWEHSPRFGTKIPVYPVEGHKIWGLTAVVTRPILHQLLKPAFLH
jgi:8-oxo-dGTP pyrophosphatase MutT (NUDIX family)